MLTPTECICFPRSGHHALADVLRTYFGEEFRYCEIYLDPPSNTLDNNPQTNYQKNHDFELKTPWVEGRSYLVQIRNPLHAIASWKALDARLGNPVFSEEAALEFYTGFVKKWIFTPPPSGRRLVVEYESLLADPVNTCVCVVQFLTRVQNVDMDRLDAALKKFPLCARK